MRSELLQSYCWYPTANGGETMRQREETATRSWLQENLSPAAQLEWLRKTANRHPGIRREEVIRTICKHDSAELVELLYPRDPDLFRKARQYTLSSTLFPCVWDRQVPYSEEVLTQCVHARTAQLDAACLCALVGATGCLEKLLEQGADPDGLDIPDSWSYIELSNRQIVPVSPMDCALLGGNEDCQMVLDMFGGKSLHEHLTDD